MKKIFLLAFVLFGSLLLHAQSSLYVMTSFGGVNDYGTISAYNTSRHTIATIYSFTASDGIYPFGSLIKSTDGKLYGMTHILHKFVNAEGEEPHGTLLLASDGLFYGTTYADGAKDAGTMFSFNPSTSTYTKLADFSNKPSGQLPEYGKPLEVIISNVPGAVFANNGPLCQGETLQLTSSGGSSYSWTGPNGFSSTLQNPSINNISVADGGNYKVQINSSNCTLTTNVDINPLPAAPV